MRAPEVRALGFVLITAACGGNEPQEPAPRARASSASSASASASAAASADARSSSDASRGIWPGAPTSLSHASAGIDKVVLRSASKDVKVTRRAGDITIGGTPTSFDAQRPEKPNEGFITGGFEFKTFGSTLLIATTGEVAYIHTTVQLRDLALALPDGVAFEHEPLELTSDRRANLGPPGQPEKREQRP